jgi:hypothetical protein
MKRNPTKNSFSWKQHAKWRNKMNNKSSQLDCFRILNSRFMLYRRQRIFRLLTLKQRRKFWGEVMKTFLMSASFRFELFSHVKWRLCNILQRQTFNVSRCFRYSLRCWHIIDTDLSHINLSHISTFESYWNIKTWKIALLSMIELPSLAIFHHIRANFQFPEMGLLNIIVGFKLVVISLCLNNRNISDMRINKFELRNIMCSSG